MNTALECLIPGDNGIHYRGTQNIASDGTMCSQWSLMSHTGNYVTPTDGDLHNYCRRTSDDSHNVPWCFIDNGSEERTCSIAMCCKLYFIIFYFFKFFIGNNLFEYIKTRPNVGPF